MSYPRSGPTRVTRKERTGSFFSKADLQSILPVLFDRMPNVYFFAKNPACELVAANKLFLERMGARSIRDISGKRAAQIDPPELALNYEEDDIKVMRTGKPLEDRMELNRAADGSVDWFITSKYPLKSRDGKIMGLIGIAFNIEKTRADFASLHHFNTATSWIHDNLDKKIRVENLAKLTGSSRRSFEKGFHRAFGISPAQYVIRCRLSAACRCLRQSRAPLSAIAQESGFYDQSAFNRAFLKHFGCTPRQYRLHKLRNQRRKTDGHRGKS